MPIVDRINVFLAHRGSVQQVSDWNENILHKYRVIGAKPQIMRGAVEPESVCDDAHRLHVSLSRVASAIDPTMADPLDRRCSTVCEP
jgi:hypothetical protein